MKTENACLSVFFLPVFLCIAFQCAKYPLEPYEDESSLMFPYKNGWLGGDGAYSIPLGSGRILWLFGDSFVRNDSVKDRNGSAMIANSVALMRETKGSRSIRYFWNHPGGGTHDAFFSSGTTAWRYWPMDGFMYNSRLYVCLMRVEPAGSGVFGFEITRIDMAEISNPQDDPPLWSIVIREVHTSSSVHPGVSIITQAGYALLYTVHDEEAVRFNRPIYLARIPLSGLDQPALNMEYLADDLSWKPGLNKADARHVMNKGATEMTVRFHPGLAKWLAVHIDNGFPARRIVVRTAAAPEGPWSGFRWSFWIPETVPDHPRYDPDYFYYAGKEHAEFLTGHPHRILVTYVGNSFDFIKLLNDLRLYSPRTAVMYVP